MWEEILRNIPIALLATIYVFDVAEIMSLIPELKGKELDIASTSLIRLLASVLNCHRGSIN